jgi:hypothetical protein
MEHVPVRRQYHEPAPLVVGNEAPIVARADNIPVQSHTQLPPPEPSKGLFTSIYDNKIIVLIIVIVIIIIALFAYVIYRKEDVDQPKPKPKKNPPPADNVAGKKEVGVSAATSEGKKEVSTDNGNSEDKKEVSTTEGKKDIGTTEQTQKTNLGILLARGRAAVTAVEEAEPEFDDEKAEQEILDLMADDSEQISTVNTSLVTPTADESPGETPGAIAAATQLPPPKLDPALCATMLKNHQCKNKPISNGKCRVHSK